MKVKHLIVGAGITGITLAQKLSEKGESVLIVEKRNHIGGNCYDYCDENGILIHKYGPHIFHTDLEDVWGYINRFSDFTNYQHKVLGFVDGNLIPIPFNLNSIYKSFSLETAKKLENTLLTYYEYNSKISITALREKAKQENNKELNFLADYIFEKIFKNYTIKQRGITADEINQDVLKRVPVVISRDDRYFPHNKYQGMPEKGYTKMFENMLESKNIKVLLNTDYKDIKGQIQYEKLYFTGSIDEYFDYKYGKLEYRKTLYTFEEYDRHSFQENAVINYPNDYEYTRITEFKKFYPDFQSYKTEKTIICKEIPGSGSVEAYPIENEENLKIFERYKKDAQELKNTYFLGRLGWYKYLDMDKAIKQVFDFFG